MKDSVDEANARGLVRVGVGKFDMNLPHSALKWSFIMSVVVRTLRFGKHTLSWSFEANKEFLPKRIGQEIDRSR